jgi:integrase
MASLRRYPKSPFFHACFTGGDGKRYQRSTGIRADGTVTTRRQAQKIADEYEDVARRQQTARQVQKVFHEIYREVTGDVLPDQTLRQFAENWLKDKKGAIATRTLGFYRSRVDSFLTELGRRADLPVFQITEADVRAWRDREIKRVTASTTNHGLKVLRMLFGDAKKRNLIAENPAETLPILKRDTKTPRRPFTMDELACLLRHVDGEWRSLVLFGLYTGQRLGDLARLRWTAIDFTSKEIRFTTDKTDRNQKIPICKPLMSHIESLKKPERLDAPLHPEAFDLVTRQGKPSTLSRQFHDLMSKAGLVTKRPHRKLERDDESRRRVASDLTFHSFRHTLTSMLKNAGVSASIAEEIVGHDSAEMNRIYTHFEDATLKRAMDCLPDVVGAENA